MACTYRYITIRYTYNIRQAYFLNPRTIADPTSSIFFIFINILLLSLAECNGEEFATGHRVPVGILTPNEHKRVVVSSTDNRHGTALYY